MSFHDAAASNVHLHSVVDPSLLESSDVRLQLCLVDLQASSKGHTTIQGEESNTARVYT